MDCFVGLLSPTLINVLVQFEKAVGKFSHLHLYSSLLTLQLLSIQPGLGFLQLSSCFWAFLSLFHWGFQVRAWCVRAAAGLRQAWLIPPPDLALPRLVADCDWPPDFDESLTAVSKYLDLLNHIFSFWFSKLHFQEIKFAHCLCFTFGQLRNTHQKGSLALLEESSWHTEKALLFFCHV